MLQKRRFRPETLIILLLSVLLVRVIEIAVHHQHHRHHQHYQHHHALTIHVIVDQYLMNELSILLLVALPFNTCCVKP